jgi:predicted CopG family antitoxin
MATKTINIRDSAYEALLAKKRSGESFSDVILRITGEGERDVYDYLRTIDPALRSEVAESVSAAKRDLEKIQPRKVSL